MAEAKVNFGTRSRSRSRSRSPISQSGAQAKVTILRKGSSCSRSHSRSRSRSRSRSGAKSDLKHFLTADAPSYSHEEIQCTLDELKDVFEEISKQMDKWKTENLYDIKYEKLLDSFPKSKDALLKLFLLFPWSYWSGSIEPYCLGEILNMPTNDDVVRHLKKHDVGNDPLILKNWMKAMADIIHGNWESDAQVLFLLSNQKQEDQKKMSR